MEYFQIYFAQVKDAHCDCQFLTYYTSCKVMVLKVRVVMSHWCILTKERQTGILFFPSREVKINYVHQRLFGNNDDKHKSEALGCLCSCP